MWALLVIRGHHTSLRSLRDVTSQGNKQATRTFSLIPFSPVFMKFKDPEILS